jgi:ubiquinone/menaquinone biosynthesis C-methylase UbiE
VIVDVGCGTGSLALLLSRVARQKAAGRAAVQWRTGMGDALVDSVGADSADTA